MNKEYINALEVALNTCNNNFQILLKRIEKLEKRLDKLKWLEKEKE